jgi:hypothetical protein
MDGNIVVHGQLTIQDKATLVQNDNSSWSGSGAVQMQQFVTGSGLTTPNGRYWFLGSPMPTTLSVDYKAQTSNVLKYFSEPLGNWQEITDAITPIEVGRGYFVQTALNDTLKFNGFALHNGTYNIACSRTGTTNFYRGFNLVSNPYASYLDFDQVTRSNLLPTMWYRTADAAQTMVFDTYNAQSGLGTSLSGIAVNQFIPPLQSFWVKIPDGFTTGSLGMTNAMRSHYAVGFEGLKSTALDFPAFLRLNIEDGLRKDQLIVYMDQQQSAQIDGFDAEKMSVSNYPQCYTVVNGKKLVINALKLNKSKNQIPLVLEFPSSKSYTLHVAELNMDNGLVLLEDKQLGVLQDLSIAPDYTFFASSGTNSTRFVLHFNVPMGNPIGATLDPLHNELEQQEEILSVLNDQQNGISVELAADYTPAGFIQLYDNSGSLVAERPFKEQIEYLPYPAVSGLYHLKVHCQNQVFTYKLVLIR